MDDREKLIELLAEYFTIGDSYAYNLTRVKEAFSVGTMSLDDFVEFDDEVVADIADHLIDNGVSLVPEARPISDWDEDDGDCLWWKFPIEEPPYVGSPLDCNWPGYHTHWTPIDVPEPPKGE